MNKFITLAMVATSALMVGCSSSSTTANHPTGVAALFAQSFPSGSISQNGSSIPTQAAPNSLTQNAINQSQTAAGAPNTANINNAANAVNQILNPGATPNPTPNNPTNIAATVSNMINQATTPQPQTQQPQQAQMGPPGIMGPAIGVPAVIGPPAFNATVAH